MIILSGKELRELTGAWYASNDFDKVQMDIILEAEELGKLIGHDIIDEVEILVKKEDPSKDELALMNHVKLPIALMATYRFYQSNIVSHENETRKLKVNKDSESIPWEWMLDRDDAAQLSKAQRAIERLLNYLDRTNHKGWLDSPASKAAKELFVNSKTLFGEYYPIDDSGRFFIIATPLIKEVQTTRIKDAMGDDYSIFLDKFQQGSLSEKEKDILSYVQRALVLATVALAVRRLNTQVLPDGIVKAFKSPGQARSSSRPATDDEISYFSKRIDADADSFINKMKLKLKALNPTELEYQLIPKNNPKNKFVTT